MSVCDRLFAAVETMWAAYETHPFVLGIRNGDLDREKFRYYILQDYLYLVDYARVFALGAAKAPDVETMQMFTDRCKSILDNEMNIHEGYMGALAITEEELQNTRMALENLSYTSYMLRVAYEEDAAAICASILACAVSYERIAKHMIEQNPKCIDDPFYGRWIQDYASDAYAKENAELIEITDTLTEGYSERQYRHLEEIFINCSRFEESFWDMSWAMRA